MAQRRISFESKHNKSFSKVFEPDETFFRQVESESKNNNKNIENLVNNINIINNLINENNDNTAENKIDNRTIYQLMDDDNNNRSSSFNSSFNESTNDDQLYVIIPNTKPHHSPIMKGGKKSTAFSFLSEEIETVVCRSISSLESPYTNNSTVVKEDKNYENKIENILRDSKLKFMSEGHKPYEEEAAHDVDKLSPRLDVINIRNINNNETEKKCENENKMNKFGNNENKRGIQASVNNKEEIKVEERDEEDEGEGNVFLGNERTEEEQQFYALKVGISTIIMFLVLFFMVIII